MHNFKIVHSKVFNRARNKIMLDREAQLIGNTIGTAF